MSGFSSAHFPHSTFRLFWFTHQNTCQEGFPNFTFMIQCQSSALCFENIKINLSHFFIYSNNQGLFSIEIPSKYKLRLSTLKTKQNRAWMLKQKTSVYCSFVSWLFSVLKLYEIICSLLLRHQDPISSCYRVSWCAKQIWSLIFSFLPLKS